MELLDIQNSYFQTMKKIYGDIFNCNCKMLLTTDLDNEQLVDELIDWADIIYEGGGDNDYMIDLWKKNNFDKKLYKAYLDGKVISGISAGAVCYFNSCTNDDFSLAECLNWFDYFMCPHANEDGRLEATKKILKETKKQGFLLSNCSAIEILDDKYKVLKCNDDAFAYKAYYENDNYIINDLEDGFIEINS